MTDVSKADAFLAQTLRALRNGESVLAPQVCSQSLWRRIEFHGIAHALHAEARKLNAWPNPLLTRIAEEARMMGLWEETHRPLLAALMRSLLHASIEATLMKGSVLAYTIYDEPAARRRSDSDILVRPRDLSRARSILIDHGWYRSADPHGLYFQEGWQHDVGGVFKHTLDLHWETSDRPILQRIMRLDDFLTYKQPLSRMGEAVFGTSLIHTLCHCAINQKWHVTHGYWAEEGKVTGARRLIWSLDFDLLARQFSDEDWQRLSQWAMQAGIGPVIAEALRGARHDIGTPLPEALIVELETVPLSAAVSRCLAAGDGMSEFWHDFKTASSWRDRCLMLAARSLPPREHLLAKYPDRSDWPTVLLRGQMMVETAARLLKRTGKL